LLEDPRRLGHVRVASQESLWSWNEWTGLEQLSKFFEF
jgi:hypothetical protein